MYAWVSSRAVRSPVSIAAWNCAIVHSSHGNGEGSNGRPASADRRGPVGAAAAAEGMSPASAGAAAAPAPA